MKRVYTLMFAIGCNTFCFPGYAQSQNLTQRAASKYRNSTVFLKVTKVTNVGTIVEEYGTGFIVTELGHILTSCHVVDRKVFDADGNVLPTIIDSVEIAGATGSRNGQLEPIANLHCSQSGFDLALLRFKNSSIKRVPIPAVSSSPSLGDTVASLGYPLNMDFFVRLGTIGGYTPDDLNTVDMSLNPGDSGGPVLNSQLRVVAIVEGGYPNAYNVGVVRPIRHAASLFAEAGVTLTAENANIDSTPIPGAPANSNVEVANSGTALLQFAAAKTNISPDADKVKVTYAIAKSFAALSQVTDNSGATPTILLSDVPAKPGYKIIDAKFIITGKEGADVVAVNTASNGNSARAVIKKKVDSQSESTAFVKGFIETTQMKIGSFAK